MDYIYLELKYSIKSSREHEINYFVTYIPQLKTERWPARLVGRKE